MRVDALFVCIDPQNDTDLNVLESVIDVELGKIVFNLKLCCLKVLFSLLIYCLVLISDVHSFENLRKMKQYSFTGINDKKVNKSHSCSIDPQIPITLVTVTNGYTIFYSITAIFKYNILMGIFNPSFI